MMATVVEDVIVDGQELLTTEVMQLSFEKGALYAHIALLNVFYSEDSLR